MIRVELGERAYPIHVVEDGLEGLGAALSAALRPGPAVVVTNPVVGRLYLGDALRSLGDAGWQARALMVPEGEAHKSLSTWQALVEDLLALRVDRRTPIVALGGGVVGDLAGFAAAAALRGLPLVQVPTSLLAMVDSAVGGKTGVNTPLGKNLVGAFHQPTLVYAALSTLRTLPMDELRSGLGEVIKHGVIRSPALFETCEARAEAIRAGEPGVIRHLVEESCRIKADFVAADEREAGLRAALNFGHTVGHALETALGHGALRHGECVALGMVAEARWAADRGLCPAEAPARIAALIERLGMVTRIPRVSVRDIIDASMIDKKRTRGRVRTAALVGIGEVVLRDVTRAEIEAMVRRLPGSLED